MGEDRETGRERQDEDRETGRERVRNGKRKQAVDRERQRQSKRGQGGRDYKWTERRRREGKEPVLQSVALVSDPQLH